MVLGHRVVPRRLSLWLSQLREAAIRMQGSGPQPATVPPPGGRLGQNLALEPAPPAPRLEQSLTLGCALGHAGEGAGVPVAAKCAGVSVHVCVHVHALVHAHFGCVSVHACVHASACACVGWLPVVPAAPALPPHDFQAGRRQEAGGPSVQPRRGAKPIAKNTYYTATFCK